jgi:hypothetical protein
MRLLELSPNVSKWPPDKHFTERKPASNEPLWRHERLYIGTSVEEHTRAKIEKVSLISHIIHKQNSFIDQMFLIISIVH